MKKSEIIERIKPEFNVILYDINKREMKSYNVIPYFLREYNNLRKKDRPKTFEEYIKFIKDLSVYRYWSRSEYEIILVDWPCQKVEEKWDVHKQIMMNIELIATILIRITRFK